MYPPDSVEQLQKAGIEFQKHEEYGILPNDFAELMITSGLVLAPETKWISFHRWVCLFCSFYGTFREFLESNHHHTTPISFHPCALHFCALIISFFYNVSFICVYRRWLYQQPPVSQWLRFWILCQVAYCWISTDYGGWVFFASKHMVSYGLWYQILDESIQTSQRWPSRSSRRPRGMCVPESITPVSMWFYFFLPRCWE